MLCSVICRIVWKKTVHHMSSRYFNSSPYMNCLLRIFSATEELFTTKTLSNEVFYRINSISSLAKVIQKPKDNTITVDLNCHPLFKSINYDEIAKKDEKLSEKMKYLVTTVYLIHDQGHLIPSCLTLDQWKELSQVKSFLGKVKYLRFLFINEKKRENDKKKKLLRREEREAFLKRKAAEIKDPTEIHYGLMHNSILLRLQNSSIDKIHNFRLFQAMMFGPKVVIDCSYEEFMVTRELKNCSKQLMYLFGLNRLHYSPLDLHFCNFDPDSHLAKCLHKYIPSLYDDIFPFNWSSKSYVDVFPKEKLVYLSPHCHEVLESINEDDVYIIGAMVDKCISEPLSLSKAQKDGIRVAKLPLDLHLEWGYGGKALTIDQCALILAEMFSKHDWKTALKTWVPKRKLFKSSEELIETTLNRPLGARHLQLSAKRNLNLYNFILREQEGEKGKKVKNRWPQ